MVGNMLVAQISIGGTPLGRSPEFLALFGHLPLAVETVPALDLPKIYKEDAASTDNRRFTAPVQVNWGLDNAGQWLDLPNGDRLWRLQLRASETKALAVLYDTFFLPEGSKFYMYSEDGKQILGGYTSRNNPRTGRFMTGLIDGATAILEYYEPKSAAGKGRIHIFRIDQAYKKEYQEPSDYEFQVKGGNLDLGFGTSLPCHININCPDGQNWEKQKRSTCRILMVLAEGFGYCSGSLLNNTNSDGTPYVLSANHCQAGYTPLYDMWRFDFNYETNGCTNPAAEPSFQSVLGCTLRASREQSDLLFMEIFDRIPQEYNVYFNGWSRVTTAPASSAHIHHPRGDIKKISVENHAAEIYAFPIVWNNGVTTPANNHFKVVFDKGTFEIGSSGGSLFDPNGRVVAQLHGGFSDCGLFIAYFGRLSMSWEGGGTPQSSLKTWLDPAQTGAMTIDGMENPINNSTAVVSGKVALLDGRGVQNVTITLLDENKHTTTDLAGNFLLENVSTNKSYTLQPSKTTGVTNGISVLDVVEVRKHILHLQRLETPYQLIAADANSSKSISLTDLVEIQKAVLQLSTEFADTPSWRFVPSDYTFPDFNSDTFSFTWPEQQQLTNLTADATVNFTAIKIGDLNNSVNPAE